jgi:hypothetical protein
LIFLKEEIDKICEMAVLEIYNWWSGMRPGYRGKVITCNKEIYCFQHYILPFRQDEGENYLKKMCVLSDDEFGAVIKFVENEILLKKHENYNLKDAGVEIIVNYNGVSKRIYGGARNNGIYGKTNSFIDKFI